MLTAAAFYVLVGSLVSSFGSAASPVVVSVSALTPLVDAAAFSCERAEDFGEKLTCQINVLESRFCGFCGLFQARNQHLRTATVAQAALPKVGADLHSPCVVHMMRL